MLNEKKNTAMGQKLVCMRTNGELMYKKQTGAISSGFWDYGYLFPKFVL